MKRNFDLASLRFHNKETALTCGLLLSVRGLCGETAPEYEPETGLFRLVEV